MGGLEGHEIFHRDIVLREFVEKFSMIELYVNWRLKKKWYKFYPKCAHILRLCFVLFFVRIHLPISFKATSLTLELTLKNMGKSVIPVNPITTVNIGSTNQCKTQRCAYFMGYSVLCKYHFHSVNWLMKTDNRKILIIHSLRGIKRLSIS